MAEVLEKKIRSIIYQIVWILLTYHQPARMSSANKVADIFSAAGEAFSRLGALAMELQQQPGELYTPGADEGKWGDEEIEMLRQAVRRFGTDLEKISTQIKSKSVGQIRSALKQKAVQQKVGLMKNVNQVDQEEDETQTGRIGVDNTPSKEQSFQPLKIHQYVDSKSQNYPSKRIRIDEGKIIVSPNPNAEAMLLDDASIIESAINKLQYETKDPHADIDIEG